MNIKIGLITTLRKNIGDDMIRKGICLIMEEIYKKNRITFIPINKHIPTTIYPSWHPVNWLKIYNGTGKRVLYKYAGKIFYNFGFSRFDKCNLIIQCGTPVLEINCHRTAWSDIIWNQVIKRLHKRVTTFNIAAGSWYHLKNLPAKIPDLEDEKYLKAILSYCQLNTVRDRLAQKLCSGLGYEVERLPCTGFLAPEGIIKSSPGKGTILINPMSLAGHKNWGNANLKTTWKGILEQLIDRLKKRHRLAFICHDEKEVSFSRILDPSIPFFLPRTLQEYSTLINDANVKTALCNRMHAPVFLAGMGIPSVAVNTDSRLQMVEELNLPCFYPLDINTEILEDHLENLLTTFDREKERLLTLKKDTWNKYKELFLCILKKD